MLSCRRWGTTTVAVAVFCCALCLYRVPAEAQRTPNPAKPPFASSIEQRAEQVTELKAIRALLEEQNRLIKEQNELLRSALPNVVPPKKS